jgi:hypothetical protein
MQAYTARFFVQTRPPFEVELWFEEDPSQWKAYFYFDEQDVVKFRRRTNNLPSGGYLDLSHLDLVERVMPAIAYRAIGLRSGFAAWTRTVFDVEKWHSAIRAMYGTGQHSRSRSQMSADVLRCPEFRQTKRGQTEQLPPDTRSNIDRSGHYR